LWDWWLFILLPECHTAKEPAPGSLTKVSKRGYVFKTYEGEILIGGINEGEGTIINTTTFKFSVPEKSVYDKLESLQGHKVVVRYKQVLKPFFLAGRYRLFCSRSRPGKIT
jgi:hypothetical protein